MNLIFHPFLLSVNTPLNALSTRLEEMNTQIVLYNPRIFQRNTTMEKWFGKFCRTFETTACPSFRRIRALVSTRGIHLSKSRMERTRILAIVPNPSLIFFGKCSLLPSFSIWGLILYMCVCSHRDRKRSSVNMPPFQAGGRFPSIYVRDERKLMELGEHGGVAAEQEGHFFVRPKDAQNEALPELPQNYRQNILEASTSSSSKPPSAPPPPPPLSQPESTFYR